LPQFTIELIRNNQSPLVIIILLNLLAFSSPFFFVNHIDTGQSSNLLTAILAFLAIITATLTLYADFVEKRTNQLYSTREKYSPEIQQRIPKVFLRLIFLQYLLWWAVMVSGFAVLLSLVFVFDSASWVLGLGSLGFLLAGVVTTLAWMHLFVFRNTPGKMTYEQLLPK
jgi:hypothetical protein